jgi:hypothetical protein
MSYTMDRLSGAGTGIVTDSTPMVVFYSCDAHEVQTHKVAIIASAVSVGVNSGNPIAVTLHHSYDEGVSWIALTGLETSAALFAAGTVTIGPGAMTALIAPLLKLTITPPTGQTVTITSVSRTHCRGDSTFVTRSPTIVSTTVAAAGVGFSVAGDAIVPTFGATSDVYALKTDGIAGAVVQTLTVNYVDATKAVILNIVRT